MADINLPDIGQFDWGEPLNESIRKMNTDLEYLMAGSGPVTLAQVAFTHRQLEPDAVWVINHPLPYEPNVAIIDSAGTLVMTEIVYVAPGLIHSIAGAGFSGTAHLS